jgi:predicted 3-demethylubiquinone-9 3-methyltransferase (glyoxalase superfamily)
MNKSIPKNTICLWYNKDAQDAARFYAATFPDSKVTAVYNAPSDYPSGKAGDVLTVEFTVLGIPCLGLNGGPGFPQSEAFSFQIATDTQEGIVLADHTPRPHQRDGRGWGGGQARL